MKTEDKIFNETINQYPRLIYTVILLIASITIYLVEKMPIALLAVWVLWFTIFDFIGYRSQVSDISYRFLQTSFQIALTGLVWFIGGWQVALAANVIWITLGCDMLYIWILKAGPYEWDYFKTSPVNFFYQVILRRNTPWNAALISAGAGLIIALIIIWI